MCGYPEDRTEAVVCVQSPWRRPRDGAHVRPRLLRARVATTHGLRQKTV